MPSNNPNQRDGGRKKTSLKQSDIGLRQQIRFPSDVAKGLQDWAESQNVPVNQAVVVAVSRLLDEHTVATWLQAYGAMHLIEIWNIRIAPLLRSFERRNEIVGPEALKKFVEADNIRGIVKGVGSNKDEARSEMIQICNWLELLVAGIEGRFARRADQERFLLSDTIRAKRDYFGVFVKEYDEWLRTLHDNEKLQGWPALSIFWWPSEDSTQGDQPIHVKETTESG